MEFVLLCLRTDFGTERQEKQENERKPERGRKKEKKKN